MRGMRKYFRLMWLWSVLAVVAMAALSGCGMTNRAFTPMEATRPQGGSGNTNRPVNWRRFAIVTDPGMFTCHSWARDCAQVARETREELLNVLSFSGIDVFEMPNPNDWKKFGRPHHLLEVSTTEEGGVDERHNQWVQVRTKVRVILHERIDPASEATRRVAVFTGSYNFGNFAAGAFFDHNDQAMFSGSWEEMARMLAAEALIEAVRRLQFGEASLNPRTGEKELDPQMQLTAWLSHYAHDQQQQAIADAVRERAKDELDAAATEQRESGRAAGETRLEVLRRRNAELTEELAGEQLRRYQQGEPIPEQPLVEQSGAGGTTVIVVDPGAAAPVPPLPLGPQTLSPEEEAMVQQLEQLQRQLLATERQLAALDRATPDQKATATFAAHQEALVRTLQQIQAQMKGLEEKLHVIQELPDVGSPRRRR